MAETRIDELSRRLALWLLSLVVVCLGVGSLSACGAPTPRDAQRVAEGEELYIQECAQCHQQDGRGYKHVYPRLDRNPIVNLPDPSPAIEVVLNGRGSMPSFRHQLTVEELAKIVSYVRQAWGNSASPVDPSQMK